MACLSMIKSWKSSAVRRFAEEGKGRFPGLDVVKAFSRLQLLDATHSLDELPPLASVRLHKLKGNRKGRWAMTINGPWRLVFGFKDGDAFDVDIVDYH